jgi:hypothetical protein
MRSPIRRTRSFYATRPPRRRVRPAIPAVRLVTVMRPSRARCVTEGYHATSVLSSCLF